MSLAKLFLVGSLLVAVAWADTCIVDPKPESLTGNWVLLYWRAPESLLPENVRCLKDWGTLVDQTVIYNTTIIIENDEFTEDEDEDNKSKKKDKNKSGSKSGSKSDKDSKSGSSESNDSDDSDSDSGSSESKENKSRPKSRVHHHKISFEKIQQRCILDFSVKQQYKLTHGNFVGNVKFIDVNREKYYIQVYTNDKGEDYFFAWARSLCFKEELFTILNNVWLNRLNVNRLEIRQVHSNLCDL